MNTVLLFRKRTPLTDDRRQRGISLGHHHPRTCCASIALSLAELLAAIIVNQDKARIPKPGTRKQVAEAIRTLLAKYFD